VVVYVCVCVCMSFVSFYGYNHMILLIGLIERNAGDGLRSYYSQLGEFMIVGLYFCLYIMSI